MISLICTVIGSIFVIKYYVDFSQQQQSLECIHWICFDSINFLVAMPYCFLTTLCFLCMMGGRMILINANALISGHRGGYYMGISQDLSTLFINLKVCTFIAGSTRSTQGIFSASAILQMELETSAFPVCEGTFNWCTCKFWQTGNREDSKRLSYLSFILILLADYSSLTQQLYFSEENSNSSYLEPISSIELLKCRSF